MEGRDAKGRFAAGWSPDRGRGKPARHISAGMDEDLRRIVMATANLPVSIPRGRGRRLVTLYEAQIRRLANGQVYRRASVMDFIRLVQKAATASPIRPAAEPSAATIRLRNKLEQLQEAAAKADATDMDRAVVSFYEMLLDMLRSSERR